MRTIRRLYLYLVAVISLQTVLWGVINLLRAMLDTQRVGGTASQLAGALATIIVGLPVFFLHWWLIQRRISSDAEERGSGVRAIFLYGLLFGLLIPVAQNLLAILNRALIDLFNLRPETGLLGVQQTWIDNGIALAMNVLLALYLMSVIRSDWRAGTQPEKNVARISLENLTLSQRIFRYVFVLYTLGLLVFGLQQILSYILGQIGPPNINALSPLANGLSLTIFGGLLWWNTWRTVEQSLRSEEEQNSLFRAVFLYVLLLIGLSTVLISTGTIVYEAFRVLLGRSLSFTDWMLSVSEAISVAVPFGLLWAYHMSVLRQDRGTVEATPRQAGLQRLYQYLVAFTGLMVSFYAMQSIVNFVVHAIVSRTGVVEITSSNDLAGSLAALVMGLPVWLRPWLKMNSTAQMEGDGGDRARRSIARKAYLYLSIFIGVVGIMISAGSIIFQLLGRVLGDPGTGSLEELLQVFAILVLFVILLVYHWQVLRNDNRMEDRSMADKHGKFPVLVLDSGDEQLAGPVVTALREEAPGIPVAIHYPSSGVPGENLSDAGAVILTSGMAANPPEAMRIWLQSFSGERIVVPVKKEGWVWIDSDTISTTKLSKQVAQTVLKLAEGEALDGSGRTSPLVIVAAIIGGLIVFSFLMNILSRLLSF